MKILTFSLECVPDQSTLIAIGIGNTYHGPVCTINKLWTVLFNYYSCFFAECANGFALGFFFL